MAQIYIAALLAATAAVVFWRNRKRQSPAQANVGGAALFTGLGVYVGGLLGHWGVVYIPVDIFGICGVSLTLAGLYANRFQGGQILWSLAASVAAVFFTAASLFSGKPELQGEVQTTLLKMHIGFILAATGFLLCLGAIAALYLLKERALRRDPAGLARRLPSLDNLDRFQLRSLQAGFVLLTIGVAFGLQLLTTSQRGPDALSLATLAVWLIIGATLYLRLWRGWRGHRLAVFSGSIIAGLSVIIIIGFGWHTDGV